GCSQTPSHDQILKVRFAQNRENMKSPDNCILTLPDGSKIFIPDSLNLITPYVLKEQNDWFEDEIRFVRLLLKPGDTAVDIGANYGIFTLAMAAAVGESGKVFTFEPASSTTAYLRESLRINNYQQVHLTQCALSNQSGKAQLAIGEHCELNALSEEAIPGSTEEVSLTTLDQFLAEHGQHTHSIDFIKIDAEGHEIPILDGTRKLLKEQSPLIQYEIKAGHEINFDLVEAFRQHGYASYRLIPGLGILMPFDQASPPDAYLLNLFAAKPDKASQLEADQLLGTPPPASKEIASQGIADEIAPSAELLQEGEAWFAQHSPNFLHPFPTQNHKPLCIALGLFAYSLNPIHPPSLRIRAIRESANSLRNLCQEAPNATNLAALARVAAAYGARALAVAALDALVQSMQMAQLCGEPVDVASPLLSPSPRFDAIPIQDSPEDWLLAAALESLEKLSSYSSFYSPEQSQDRLKSLSALGYASDEMLNRLALIQKRFGAG
ncbi:MAG: FkbM family methyltransferase, partial [Cyanobacteriota bacterium]